MQHGETDISPQGFREVQLHDRRHMPSPPVQPGGSQGDDDQGSQQWPRLQGHPGDPVGDTERHRTEEGQHQSHPCQLESRRGERHDHDGSQPSPVRPQIPPGQIALGRAPGRERASMFSRQGIDVGLLGHRQALFGLTSCMPSAA